MSAAALRVIAEVAGQAMADRLVLRLGGTELKISGRPGGKLAKLVGDQAARAIAEALGPEKIVVPMAQTRGQKGRQAAVARLLADGLSQRDAALACDVHERTALRIAARMRTELPLLDLLKDKG